MNKTNLHVNATIPNESPQLLPALLRMLADDLETNGGKPAYKLGPGTLTLRIVRFDMAQAGAEYGMSRVWQREAVGYE